MHLRSVTYIKPEGELTFPHTLPIIQNLETLDLKPVTFFVGENGSGKSTLLEGIAAACNLFTIGSVSANIDPTLTIARQFADYLKLTWTIKTNKGFFLRAEDFFGFIKSLEQLKASLKADENELSSTLTGYGRLLALGSLREQYRNLQEMYGNLDAISHGEGFLHLFSKRLFPNGIYLLDEPEAALSPSSQIKLITQIREMLPQNCQFIIATHSPILLATPNALIYNFAANQIKPIEFNKVPHVTLTKAFLNCPEAFI